LSDLSLAGFLLSRHWRDQPDGVELEYWFRTDEGTVQVSVTGEQSVFFVRDSELDAARLAVPGLSGGQVKSLPLKAFDGEPLSGVYFRSHRRARRVSDHLIQAGIDPLEADINPAERYLMERFVTGGAFLQGQASRRGRHLQVKNPRLKGVAFQPRLRVVSFDIETAMEGLELYSIAVHGYDDEGEQRRVFMVGRGASQDYVHSCRDQEAVLVEFLRWLEHYDPDVLIGWNVVNFDTWYLQRLADALGRKLTLGRGGRTVNWRELDDDGERRAAQLPGRVLLDGIELLRAAFYRFESFSLENVSQQLLGEGKLLHGSGRGEEIGELFRGDKTRLAQYNLRDCELVSRIFQQEGLLEFAVARSGMTGLNLDRMGGSVASFDNLYLPRLHRRGYVAPNASRDLTASPGGFVLDSAPGIYDHVVVLDFKSLYPSIIRTFRIDPLGLALGCAGDLEDSQTVPGFLDARFARGDAILPDLIEHLWLQRDEARRADNSALNSAIKILMNSFYGVLGTSGCRFFDARLASSITRRGHQILQRTRDRIEEAGHRVIYGDTDSVFVWIHEAEDDAAAQRAGRKLEADLNQWWSQRLLDEYGLHSVLELEFETHYRRFLMPTIRGSEKGSKKRYAGVVRSAGGDRLVFKGLESVRTDWTRLARDFQEELYRRVFMEEPFEEYVKQVTAAVLAGECDGQLVYRKRLRRKLDEYQRNVPPHVQAARLFEQRGLVAPTRGAWVDYVITGAGAEPAEAALSPLDYQHYVDRQLEPVADGILGFVGTSFRTLVDAQIDLF
jgi:DNA polymerase II